MRPLIFYAKYSPMWGQPVVVIDKPGASQIIATDFVAKQSPDAHTILAGTGGIVQNSAFRKNLPYDLFKDIAPVSQLYITRLLLAVDASLPVRNVQELIALAKSQPGKLNFASYGKGLTAHLLMEKLNHDQQIQIVHVPYQGTVGAVRAVLAGDSHMTIADLGSLRAHVASGKMRIIAATGGKRSPYVPEIPTFQESGVLGFDLDQWAGWFTTGNSPEAAAVKIAADLKSVMATPEVQAYWTQGGLEFATTTPAVLRDIMRKDYAYFTELSKLPGLVIE